MIGKIDVFLSFGFIYKFYDEHKKSHPKMAFENINKCSAYANTSFTKSAASWSWTAEWTLRPDSSMRRLASSALVP